ncbi:hypothetical protein Gpo141_00014151 [Globisporangium polare]
MDSPSDSSNQHHAGKHHDHHKEKHHDKGTKMHGSDMPSHSTGKNDPNLDDSAANSGTGNKNHHHHQGFAQQQPHAMGLSQQQGAGYEHRDAAGGFNHDVRSNEYDNDRNKLHDGKKYRKDKHHDKDKNHEDESFAARMMEKVKQAGGIDHPKQHHNRDDHGHY